MQHGKSHNYVDMRKSNMSESEFNGSCRTFRYALYILIISLLFGGWTIGWSVYIKADLNKQLENFKRENYICRNAIERETAENDHQRGEEAKTIVTASHIRQGNDDSVEAILSGDHRSNAITENIKSRSVRSTGTSSNIALPNDTWPVDYDPLKASTPQQRRASHDDDELEPTIEFLKINEVDVIGVQGNDSVRRIARNTPTEAVRVRAAPANQNRNGRKQVREGLQPTTKMVAAHFIAPHNFPRQYESGPMVSFNATRSKDVVYRFWKKADWVDRRDFKRNFHLNEDTGHVHVKKEGMYLVYAQVVYHDLSGRWSYGIYVGDTERVKCLATEQLRDLTHYDQTSHGVYQHCYTAQVMYIKELESITIRCMYGSRKILTKPEFTFWGIVKL